MTSSPRIFAALFSVTLFAGCAPAQTATPPATPASAASAPPPAAQPTAPPAPPVTREESVYRFDFTLSAKDGAAGAPSTAFTLNLAEDRPGEVMLGKNVPLVPPGPAGSPAPSPRQDVGVKVKARYKTIGENVLLEVTTEMSAFEPPSSIRKVVAMGNAFAKPGQATLVLSLDDDHKHYELDVTPTKVR